jgi:hypothetical protein
VTVGAAKSDTLLIGRIVFGSITMSGTPRGRLR